jgi:hypothetical protein
MSAAPQQPPALCVLLCFCKKILTNVSCSLQQKFVKRGGDTCICETLLTWTQRRSSPQVQPLFLLEMLLREDPPLLLHLTIPQLLY